MNTHTHKSDGNVSSGQILIIFTTMHKASLCKFLLRQLLHTKRFITCICMLHIRFPFSPLLIHIWEEKYIYIYISFFLLSDSCMKCMEIRVLKRTAASAKMNKISNSYSGYKEREGCKVIGWFYWQRVYTANPLCSIKSH